MTVIAYRGGVMAADTAEWCADVCISTEAKKVHRAPDGSLVGCAGSVADIASFRRWIDGGSQGDVPFKNEEENSFGAIVVRPDGSIWKYDGKCRPYPCAGQIATEGCHEPFLLSALLAGSSAVEAVQHAIRYCSYAGGEVYALALDGNRIVTGLRQALAGEVAIVR